MQDRDGPGPRPGEGYRDARDLQAGGWRSETTAAGYTARESADRGAVARFYEQEAGQEAPLGSLPRE